MVANLSIIEFMVDLAKASLRLLRLCKKTAVRLESIALRVEALHVIVSSYLIEEMPMRLSSDWHLR